MNQNELSFHEKHNIADIPIIFYIRECPFLFEDIRIISSQV